MQQTTWCYRILIDDVSLNMFTNICRGLFEKDKMLYAFMIAVGILRQAGKVRQTDRPIFARATQAKSEFWHQVVRSSNTKIP